MQSFIDENMWDEARVITNEQMIVGEGVQAPALRNHKLRSTEKSFPILFTHLRNKTTGSL
ncbi:MAG: hypothetical protein ICV66_07085 [Chitinophagaceae bacterium]|nr:hypothetical protein [Chitinophagaceae bacterium]